MRFPSSHPPTSPSPSVPPLASQSTYASHPDPPNLFVQAYVLVCDSAAGWWWSNVLLCWVTVACPLAASEATRTRMPAWCGLLSMPVDLCLTISALMRFLYKFFLSNGHLYQLERIPPVHLLEAIPCLHLLEKIPPVHLLEKIPPMHLLERIPSVLLLEKLPTGHLLKRIPPASI